MSKPNVKLLSSIPNEWPDSDYEVNLVCEEFTCLCPDTSKPDFATISIHYVPGEKLVEMMSLKSYLASYRDFGTYQESAVNRICQDLVAAIKPRAMEVKADFSARGGIKLCPVAFYNE